MVFQYRLRTRYSETAQDGIIHHSSYVVYLETARLEFFQQLGIDINELEKEKIFCPVVELSLNYLKSLYSLEDIVIEVSVGDMSKVRFTLGYQIFRERVCVTKGKGSHCFLNASFKPIRIPEKILRALSDKKG